MQAHIRFIRRPTAFTVIADRTGSHHVGPDMSPAHVPWDNVVDGQIVRSLPAVLAGIIITAEHFPPGQFQMWPGPVDHFLQPYDRWTRERSADCLNLTTPIYH